jgi:hypothetical protein
MMSADLTSVEMKRKKGQKKADKGTIYKAIDRRL